TREESYEEFVFHVDQANLLQYGLTTGQIVMMLYPDNSRDVLTTLEKDGNKVEVVVQKDVNLPQSVDDLLATPVPTAMGTVMKLGDLVEVEEGYALNTLARNKGQYYATVSGTIIGADVSKASSEVNKQIDELEFPKGVELGNAGAMADIIDAFTQLGIAMIAAIAIVYFILVVTFSEGLAPFVILLSLPFTVIGVFVGLYIAGETVSVQVM